MFSKEAGCLGVIIIGVAVVFIWAVVEAKKDNEKFEAAMVELKQKCLSDGESKWVCDSLVQSHIATREAQSAHSAATAASITSGFSAGMAAGRR